MKIATNKGNCIQCGSSTNIQLDCGKFACIGCLNELGRETKNIREYLDEVYPNGYKDEDLTLDDFNELEGDYCEKGVAYVLNQIIDDIPIEFAYDYYGVQYILYTPTYPWFMTDTDKTLTKEDVENMFKKYVKILTDKDINIDYYSVENGG